MIINSRIQVPEWCRYNIAQVTNNLFISDESVASYMTLLTQLNIRRVISILDEEDMPRYPRSIQHLCIALSDYPSSRIRQYFRKAYSFIREAPRGENVLIHCLAGISRSATLVIAYLMQAYQFGWHKAAIYLRSCRDVIDPNPGFRKQLQNFQEELYYTRKRRKRLDHVLYRLPYNCKCIVRQYLYSCSF